MPTAKQLLYEAIRGCFCDFKLPETRPFNFPILNQRVMLISYCPSFQAVHRPLSSTRFFRHAYLALCGLRPVRGSETPSSFFHNRIYWTHYHKCYFPRDADPLVPRALPKQCSEYLPQEVDLLSPEVIVLLGEPVVSALLKRDLRGPDEVLTGVRVYGIPCIATGFPRTGGEAGFTQVRTLLKNIVQGIDHRPVPPNARPREPEGNGMMVHTWFELASLQYYWQALKQMTRSELPERTNPVLEEWFLGEVAPRWAASSFIIACYSFLEDQLQPILAEQPPLMQQATLKNGQREVVERTLDRITRATGQQQCVDPDLRERIRSLRALRNCMAHGGGRVLAKQERAADVEGVSLEPSGVMRVDERVLKFALGVVRDFVRYVNIYELRGWQ